MKLNFPEHLSTTDLIKYFWTLKIASSIYQIFLNVLSALWYREPYLQCYDTIKIFTYKKDECYYFSFLYLLLLFLLRLPIFYILLVSVLDSKKDTILDQLRLQDVGNQESWRHRSMWFWVLGLCVNWFLLLGFPGSAGNEEPAYQCRRQKQVWSLCQEDPLEDNMATHFSRESYGERSLEGFSP